MAGLLIPIDAVKLKSGGAVPGKVLVFLRCSLSPGQVWMLFVD
jgi:hypothetical protein